MIARTALLSAWLTVGAAAVIGLYWMFLGTTEADVLRLAFSALLTLAMVLVTGIVVNAALSMASGATFRSSVARSYRSLHAFLAAAAVAAVLIWTLRLGDAWLVGHFGEISAWFIVSFDWQDITPLFTSVQYISAWLKWVVIPMAALATLANFVRHRQWRPAVRAVTAAWRWRPLLLTTVVFVVVSELARRTAMATPDTLPPTWVQPVVAVLRLSFSAAAIAVGVAIAVLTATRAVTAQSD